MVTIRRAGALALAALLLLAASAAAKPAGFPVTIKTANGPVTLTAKPVRIVSLSPTATEDLFAIGAGPQVIAVDSDSDYPPNAPITKLSAYTPNAEAIAAYKPDLVVTSYDANGLIAALGKLSIPVILQGTAASLADTYTQIDQLGAATGRATAAAALVATHEEPDRLDRRGSAEAQARRSPSTTSWEPTYYSVTSKTFIGKLFTLLGLHEHRRRGRQDELRLSAALRRVHRRRESRPDRPLRHQVLWPDRGQGEGAARLEHGRRALRRRHHPDERRHRLALGAADRDFIRTVAAKVTALVRAGK